MDNYESVMDSDQISARENPLPLLSISIEKKKPTRTPTRTILKYYAGKLLSSPHTAYTYILSLCQGKHFSFSFLLSWAPQRYRNPKNPHPPPKKMLSAYFLKVEISISSEGRKQLNQISRQAPAHTQYSVLDIHDNSSICVLEKGTCDILSCVLFSTSPAGKYGSCLSENILNSS